MQTYRLTVEPDGRVAIPDTRPGQTITIQMTPDRETAGVQKVYAGPIPEEERAAIKARVLQLAKEIHEGLPEPWRSMDHGDLLYGEDGLPK